MLSRLLKGLEHVMSIPVMGAARLRGATASSLGFAVLLMLLVRADRGGRAKMPFAAARKCGDSDPAVNRRRFWYACFTCCSAGPE